MLSNTKGKKEWSMKGPIVSIDVSKGKSDYQAFKEMNVKYTGSRSIKHTKEWFGTTSRKRTHKIDKF